MTTWKRSLTALLFIANPAACEDPSAVQPRGHEATPQPNEPAAQSPEEPPAAEAIRWDIEASHTLSDEEVTLEVRTLAETRVLIEEDTRTLFEGTTDAEGTLRHTLTPTTGPHTLLVRAFDGDEARALTRVRFEFTPPPYPLDSVQITPSERDSERRIQLDCGGELVSEFGERVPTCASQVVLSKRGELQLEIRAEGGRAVTLGEHRVTFDEDGVAHVDEALLALLGALPITALEAPTLALPITLETSARTFRGHLELQRDPLDALFIESLYKPHRFPRTEDEEDGIALLFIHQSQKLWETTAPKGSTIADIDRLAFAVEVRVDNRRCRHKNHVRDRFRQDLYVVIYELRPREAKLIAEEEIKAPNLPCPEYPWDDDAPIISRADPARAVEWVGNYAGTFY